MLAGLPAGWLLQLREPAPLQLQLSCSGYVAPMRSLGLHCIALGRTPCRHAVLDADAVAVLAAGTLNTVVHLHQVRSQPLSRSFVKDLDPLTCRKLRDMLLGCAEAFKKVVR